MDRWKFVNEKWIPRPVSRGEGFVLGIAVLSYRSLIVAFPTRGRLCVGDSAFLTQPPPLRGTSFHRKEGMTTRAPSLGRGCRAQRGGVGFLFGRRSGAFVNGVLETISPALFHTARTLSGSLRSPPSPRGEGFVSGILLPPIQPPPLRGTSFHRKEGVSTQAPSLGRGCRAQRGGVGFLFLRPSRLLFAFPMQGKRCYPCAIIHKQPCPYDGKPKRRREHPAPL